MAVHIIASMELHIYSDSTKVPSVVTAQNLALASTVEVAATSLGVVNYYCSVCFMVDLTNYFVVSYLLKIYTFIIIKLKFKIIIFCKLKQ